MQLSVLCSSFARTHLKGLRQSWSMEARIRILQCRHRQKFRNALSPKKRFSQQRTYDFTHLSHGNSFPKAIVHYESGTV